MPVLLALLFHGEPLLFPPFLRWVEMWQNNAYGVGEMALLLVAELVRLNFFLDDSVAVVNLMQVEIIQSVVYIQSWLFQNLRKLGSRLLLALLQVSKNLVLNILSHTISMEWSHQRLYSRLLPALNFPWYLTEQSRQLRWLNENLSAIRINRYNLISFWWLIIL